MAACVAVKPSADNRSASSSWLESKPPRMRSAIAPRRDVLAPQPFVEGDRRIDACHHCRLLGPKRPPHVRCPEVSFDVRLALP